MTSIVTSILSSTLGLLWNKARDGAANCLKDRDVTDAKIREIFVRELNDIKTKLDALSLKDLLSSYMFLERGVELLSDLLDKSNNEQKAVMNEDKDDGSVTSSKIPSGGDILNDVLQLSQAMEKYKKTVPKQFEKAKERFKEADKQATLAFCNEALSIQDRIVAAKLCVVSEILECLDSPDTAVTSCLFILRKVHNLSAVREVFSVYLGRGVRSKFGKTERVQIVKSVMMINYVLYQFIWKYSTKYYRELNWPIIQLSDRTVDPIWSWREVSERTSWGDELKQPPNKIKVDKEILPAISAVNSRGEIVAGHFFFGVTIISRTGKTKSASPVRVLWNEDKDGRKIKHEIASVAVDEENNVYLIVFYYQENGYEKSEPDHVVLYVFDEHCNHVKLKSELNSLPKLSTKSVRLAVNKNKDIVMIGDDCIYVCDVTGQLKYKFKPKRSPSFIGVSKNNEIIIGSLGGNIVEIYTEEGNLKTTIKLPEGHEVRGVAFHFSISKISVLSRHPGEDQHTYYLYFYSETGEHDTSTCLSDITYNNFATVTSHPRGPALVLTRKTTLYL